jgi:hypothetical protein
VDFRQAADVRVAATDLTGIAQLLRQRPGQPLHSQQPRDIRPGHRTSRNNDDHDDRVVVESETRNYEEKKVAW